MASPSERERVKNLGDAITVAADAAGIGISVVFIGGPQPTYAYISDVGAQILGYPREELMRRPIMSLLAPGEDARMAERGALRARGEEVPATFELAVITQQGERRPLEVTVTDINLERRKTAVSFFTDITIRKSALEELARSEARFRRLVESAPEGVWIARGTRLLFVNPAAVRMLGHPDADSVLALSALDIVHPDERDTLLARTRELVESGRPLSPREYRTVRKDGVSIIVEVQSIPMEFEGQRAASFLAESDNVCVDKPLNLDALRATLDSMLDRPASPRREPTARDSSAI